MCTDDKVTCTICDNRFWCYCGMISKEEKFKNHLDADCLDYKSWDHKLHMKDLRNEYMKVYTNEEVVDNIIKINRSMLGQNL